MGFLGRILNRPLNDRTYVAIPVGYPADDCVVSDITKKLLDQLMVRV